MSKLTQSPAWQALEAHALRLNAQHLRELFARDPERAQRFSAEGGGLFLDYSRQLLDDEARDALLAFGEQQQLAQWRDRMFGGEAINLTERREVLHVALRAPKGDAAYRQVGDEVHAVLERMYAFARALRSGELRGATGARITDVVNIGIGGSDFGPRMVCDALNLQVDGPRPHFVANVDGADLHGVLKALEPESTLFIVASKTFTTLETIANAKRAREWIVAALGDAAVPSHFAAVSTSAEAVRAFGIAADRQFGFWNWVGGRYSLWSAIGLSIIVALGPERFAALLAGAHAMDRHFATAPMAQNLPMLMGLIGVWNSNFVGCASQVVVPYAEHLRMLCGWAQQLELESNGKGVNRDGIPVDYRTTPALWGSVGSNAQHAYFQMLHQGPERHAVDFILPAAVEHPYADMHHLLIANCLAQSAALMHGKPAEQVREELTAAGLEGATLEAAIPHRVFPGNRPSNTVLMPILDAWHLGALLALYEHRTFVQSVLWQVNAFDQWGVELGKQTAQRIIEPKPGDEAKLDATTRALRQRLAAMAAASPR
ncbi:MAG TPA: glucose-6-phosphate isomerase [Fontimonas sp.]